MASPMVDRRLGLVGNIAVKTPVTVLAASNITLSGQQTIDGVAVLAVNAAGVPDRVLCVGQTNTTQNGIYDVSTGSWSRSVDANGNFDLGQGTTVLVNSGTTYAGTYWKVTTADPITIGTTALAWGRALASDLSTQSFLQSGASATARPVQDKMREEPADLKDFGGVCDGVTDDYQALLKAYNSGHTRIRIPAQFYTSQTLYVQKHLIFEGAGAGRLSSTMNSIWKTPSGITAVVVERGSLTYGDDSEFFGISFEAASRNVTTTTGSITAASKSLALAAAQDFATGQLVLVRGAGTSYPMAPSWYLTAATTAGSATVTLSQTVGAFPGMVLQVAGANFPAGTYVLSRVANVLTMSANAVNTVAAGAVTAYDDLVGLVMSGGGTLTLTLNEAAVTTVTAAKVEHYDCAIYSQSRIKATNVRGTNLSGATVYVHSGADVDSRSGQATNANNFLLRDIIGDNGRNVIRTRGGDSNAGCVDNSIGISSITEYNFVESSLLGNCYVSCHVSGGYGYQGIGSGNTSTFVGCYREGGTYNSFDRKILVLGGNMGSTAGAAEGGCALLNTTDVLISSAIKPFSASWPGATMTFGQNTATNNPIMQISATALGGNASIDFRRSTLAGEGAAGLWGYFPSGAYQNTAILWPDSGHPSGQTSGSYHRNGINLGSGTGTLSTAAFRHVAAGSAPPAAGVQGDVFFNTAGSSGTNAGWYCTVSSTSAATWRTFGTISTST